LEIGSRIWTETGINDQYRICFTMTEKGSTAIEVVDYH